MIYTKALCKLKNTTQYESTVTLPAMSRNDKRGVGGILKPIFLPRETAPQIGPGRCGLSLTI